MWSVCASLLGQPIAPAPRQGHHHDPRRRGAQRQRTHHVPVLCAGLGQEGKGDYRPSCHDHDMSALVGERSGHPFCIHRRCLCIRVGCAPAVQDTFGKSDPFLRLSRVSDDGVPIAMFKTEVIMKTLNPTWRVATASMQQLCNGDPYRNVLIECFDWVRPRVLLTALCPRQAFSHTDTHTLSLVFSRTRTAAMTSSARAPRRWTTCCAGQPLASGWR